MCPMANQGDAVCNYAICNVCEEKHKSNQQRTKKCGNIIAIVNNHKGVNTTKISPQSQSTRTIKYDTSDDRANEKEKDCLLTFY